MLCEIVTHCWRYSKVLAWQLNSLRTSWLWRDDVQLTVLVAPRDEDPATHDLLEAHQYWAELRVIVQPRAELFVRAIGRHQRALATEARWLWHCDADYLLLPSVFQALEGLDPADPAHRLVYPRHVWISQTHAIGQEYLERGPVERPFSGLDFARRRTGKAIGGIQIVPGQVAREVGYCPSRRYQRPAPTAELFLDTRSDRAFRVGLGTPGTAVDLPGVYRLRHERAGRFESVDN